MNTFPFQDAVTIDTNVFVHILNDQNNQDKHINAVLKHLQKEDLALLLDKKNRIMNEYKDRIIPLIRESYERLEERHILMFWIDNARKERLDVRLQDELMSAIKNIIYENEMVDRILVYVAFRQGKTLITNDSRHIISGSSRDGGRQDRRTQLLSISNRRRKKEADIVTSLEAFHKIKNCEDA